MSLLSLLTVASVFFFSTQAFACYYERMSTVPSYAGIDKPKQMLNVPKAHGICVAPNGNFAVVSWNKEGKISFFLSCGKPWRAVDLRKQGIKNNGQFGDCVFTKHRLYVTDSTGKIYELSTNGKLLKTLKTSEPSFRISACENQLFVTSRQHLIIYDQNGKVMNKLRVPGEARGVLLGMNDKFYVTMGGKKGVYSHSRRLDDDVITNEKAIQAATTTYKEISYADGLAMDTAGNLLLADHSGRVLVYSPCGEMIKTVKTTGGGAVDVEIGNDGTILVAVPSASKVLLY